MITGTIVRMTMLAACIGLFEVTPLIAQSAEGTSQQTGVSQHHQAMYDLMKDMSQEMNKMTEEMSHGPLAPEQQKQMAQRMKRMSTLMQRMSGLQAKPAIKEPEAQKQLRQMRKQMDDMMRDKKAGGPAK